MNKPYRVLIDCERMKYPYTGLYYYCLHLGKGLLAATTNRQICFYSHKKNKHVLPGSCFVPHNPLHKAILPDLKDFAIWHSTYHGSSYYPWQQNIKIVLTVHDLNFLYDAGKAGWKKKRNLSNLKAKLERADHVVVISNFVRKEIESHFKIPDEKLSVIYNGCTIEEICDLTTPEIKPSSPFLFTIGNIVDKKNFHVLPALLKNNDTTLIIAGVTGSEGYKTKIINEAKALGVEERVVFTGPVSENDKQWYFKNCQAFVFPSISEGFGLPVIEAMYFGKPVILSPYTSLPEIGGSAAYYFKSFDPDHMQAVLQQSLDDFNINDRSKEMKERALLFNWNEVALQYHKVYETLLPA